MKLFKDPQPAELTLTYFSAAIYSPSDVASLLREVKSSFTLIMLKCLYIRDSAGETMKILSKYVGHSAGGHMAFMCGSSLTWMVKEILVFLN